MKLEVPVRIFDPALPFERHEVSDPDVDTWHPYSIITKNARAKVPFAETIREENLPLSGGMHVRAPLVKVGFQIGSLSLESCQAFVVDSGYHDVLLGREALEQLFSVGWAATKTARVATPAKDDPSALAIQLYPVSGAPTVAQFETMLRGQRRLHNLALLTLNEVVLSPKERGAFLVGEEVGIPEEHRLRLTWVDSGSIWITLRSGCSKALRYVAKFFDTSASAKLAEQLSDAQAAENRAHISRETRDKTAARINEEEDRLRAENIHKTYSAWRAEVRDRVNFTDEMIDRSEDAEERQRLKMGRDAAIAELVETQMLPIVRNVPRPDWDDGTLRLPPPKKRE